MTESEDRASSARVSALAREVEEFVATAGWNRPPQLFALVPTADILDQQPELAAQLDAGSEFTPIAQDELPEGDLVESLGRIAWPESVVGCALAQEIVVLPPDAEAELPEVDDAGDQDAERLRRAAADHPRRTEARLVAAVLRTGETACVMRLRGIVPVPSSSGTGEDSPDSSATTGPEGDAADTVDMSTDEIIESPDLAPNLVDALHTTLQP